jgi:cold shock CspA family protein
LLPRGPGTFLYFSAFTGADYSGLEDDRKVEFASRRARKAQAENVRVVG